MFGFSITKLLFTAVAIFVVWQGFKWYAHAQQVKAERKEELRRNPASASSSPKPAATQEMVKCEVCDTYVPSDTSASCGRDGCPYP